MRWVAVLLMLANPALALDLAVSGTVTASQVDPAGSLRLPDAPWAQTTTVPIIEGAIKRTAYRLPNVTLTTLQMIAPLRAQLTDAGYTSVFSCAANSCGGFDFRFQLDLLPAPEMYVDLGNYRYLLMRREGADPHSVAITASRSESDGFIHITEVSAAVIPDPEEAPVSPLTNQPSADVITNLTAQGHAILADLDFETGATTLGPGPFPTLQALAVWLDANPTARIALVGHTDAVGSLDANTTLSQRRAAAVASRLVDELGANPLQLSAAGAGYLSPVASNLTEEGRAANRRVEVVLLSRE